MTEPRAAFLAAVHAVTPLLERPELAARWDEESALERFPVRGLAGHLLRATTSVEIYLDRPEPEPGDEPLSAAAYFAAAIYSDIGDAPYTGADLDSDLHAAIRARGEESAAGGPAGLAAEWSAAAGRLSERLATEPPGRRMRVFAGMVLTLDDYLATRLVELCVHTDDLAVSLGVPAPAVPEGASGLAIATLLQVARLRHGDPAVIRALTRRERDAVSALRVI